MSEFRPRGGYPEGERPGFPSRFRRQPDWQVAFAAIAREMGYEVPPEEPEEPDITPALNFINCHGVRDLSLIVRDTFEYQSLHSEPADPSDVIEYLSYVPTGESLKITDIGSVDAELINQLHLTKQNYIEELRDLLPFIDAGVSEFSVLELPRLRQKMLTAELDIAEKAIISRVMDAHGIAIVFDRRDQKAWNDQRILAEELSSQPLRHYSIYLRNRKKRGNRTPILDVVQNIGDRLQIREEAYQIVRDNVNAPPHERHRLLEGLSQHKRQIVEQLFEDVDAFREATNS